MARNRHQTHSANETLAPSDAIPEGTPLSEARIADRAYFRWLDRGCPTGDDLRDWFEAEEELRKDGDGANGRTT